MTTASPHWWRALYDDIVAELFLVRKDSDELRATVAFLQERLRLRPGDSVFDQGCGVGALALPLARAGLRIVGVDQAAGYVDRARREAQREQLDCEFHAGDAAAFVPARPCSAAFSWGTSFGNADEEGNRRMLLRTREALLPGGWFALDYQHIPRVLRAFQRGLVHRHVDQRGETVLLRESTIDLARGSLCQQWTFFFPDGRREVRHSALRLYLPHELARMLLACGFVELEFHGGLRGEPLTLDSPRCILIGRRPSP
jgi:SAM-dependent methyltransferase